MIYTCLCTYTHMCVYIYIYIYLSISLSLYTYIYIYIDVYKSTTPRRPTPPAINPQAKRPRTEHFRVRIPGK